MFVVLSGLVWEFGAISGILSVFRRSGCSAMLSFIRRILRNPSKRKRSGNEAIDEVTQIKQICSVISSSDFLIGIFIYAKFPNEALAGMDPVQHYACHGAFAGLNPGPRFSTDAYLSANPDVAASGMNALLVWMKSTSEHPLT